jgi:hypothetical protein
MEPTKLNIAALKKLIDIKLNYETRLALLDGLMSDIDIYICVIDGTNDIVILANSLEEAQLRVSKSSLYHNFSKGRDGRYYTNLVSNGLSICSSICGNSCKGHTSLTEEMWLSLVTREGCVYRLSSKLQHPYSDQHHIDENVRSLLSIINTYLTYDDKMTLTINMLKSINLISFISGRENDLLIHTNNEGWMWGKVSKNDLYRKSYMKDGCYKVISYSDKVKCCICLLCFNLCDGIHEKISDNEWLDIFKTQRHDYIVKLEGHVI